MSFQRADLINSPLVRVLQYLPSCPSFRAFPVVLRVLKQRRKTNWGRCWHDFKLFFRIVNSPKLIFKAENLRPRLNSAHYFCSCCNLIHFTSPSQFFQQICLPVMTSRWIVMALWINIELNPRHLVRRINKWPVANWCCFILFKRHKRLASAQQLSPLHSPPTPRHSCWKTDPHLILIDRGVPVFCFIPSLALLSVSLRL